MCIIQFNTLSMIRKEKAREYTYKRTVTIFTCLKFSLEKCTFPNDDALLQEDDI